MEPYTSLRLMHIADSSPSFPPSFFIFVAEETIIVSRPGGCSLVGEIWSRQWTSTIRDHLLVSTLPCQTPSPSPPLALRAINIVSYAEVSTSPTTTSTHQRSPFHSTLQQEEFERECEYACEHEYSTTSTSTCIVHLAFNTLHRLVVSPLRV